MTRSPFFAAVLAAALAACSKSPSAPSAGPASPPPSLTEAIAPSARADVPPAPAQPAGTEKQGEPSAAEKAEFERPVRK